jgi:hypothetical protein
MADFTMVRREQDVKRRASSESFAVQVTSIERTPGRTYVIGTSIPYGTTVRVALGRRNAEMRANFDTIGERVAPGGVVAFGYCTLNPNGTWEAASFRVVTRAAEMLSDVYEDYVRIGPLVDKGNGKFVQTLQHADVGHAERCSGYDAVLNACLRILEEPGYDKPGVIVRGVDENGNPMAVEIVRAWDTGNGCYFSAKETLNRFMDGAVNVSGLGQPYSMNGHEFMNMVVRFDKAIWEVIPMRSATLTPRSQADDRSGDYRFDPSRPSTGFLKSLVGVSVRPDGGYYVNAVFPTGEKPVPLAYLPTQHTVPAFTSKFDTGRKAVSEGGNRPSRPGQGELLDINEIAALAMQEPASSESSLIDITEVAALAASMPDDQMSFDINDIAALAATADVPAQPGMEVLGPEPSQSFAQTVVSEFGGPVIDLDAIEIETEGREANDSAEAAAAAGFSAEDLERLNGLNLKNLF